MAKVALLIGVSEYEPSLNPLPAAVKDVEAMQRVLQDVELGNFTEVKTLQNPDRQTMEEAIETLFSDRARDEIVLLFFSGHGIKDDSGNLYFATRTTRQNRFMSTAVHANFVHRMMEKCRSKRQVVILDCCFSGSFAEGLLAKDDGSVDIKKQLGGEGRAVLTSSTSTQRSFEHQGFDLSIYTHFLVEGLRTGVADRDNDGAVSVDELHEYACEKVQETAPAKMKPEIYPIKEGGKILLAKVKIDDPRLRYRREVERFANRGEISFTNHITLEELRDSLKLSSKETNEIEEEVLKPHKEYKRKLQRYEQALDREIKREYPLGIEIRQDLKRLQQVLGLPNEDITMIEERLIPKKEGIPSPENLVESEESYSSSSYPNIAQTDRINQELAGTQTVNLGFTDSGSLEKNSHQPSSNIDVSASLQTAPDLNLINSRTRSGYQVQFVVAGIAILVLGIGGWSHFYSRRFLDNQVKPSPTMIPNNIDFGVLNNYEIRIYYRKNRSDLAGDAKAIEKKFTESEFKGKIQLYSEDDSFFKKLNYPSTNPPVYEIRYDKNEAVAADRLEKFLKKVYPSKQFKKLDIGYISENSMSIFLGS